MFMKNIFTLIFFMSWFPGNSQFQNFHDFNAQTILGNDTSFSEFYGKKILVVNTASFCEYTPQYASLEQVYDLYHDDYNFEIIGFPCNNFGNQEPGTDSTIIEFCQNYGISFTMMHRIGIITQDTAPIYKWLQRANLNGVGNFPVTWNFHKCLIDEAGNLVGHYPSQVQPVDTVITNWIQSPSVLLPTAAGSVSRASGITCISSNPASDQLLFRVDGPGTKTTISILGLDGRLVRQVYNGITDKVMTINFPVNDLQSGVYFIVTEANGIRNSSKWVIAH